MKKSWKKGIAAAMSVLLAAGMAGCGQTNTANSTATSGDAATTAQTEAAQSNTDNGDLTVVKILGRNYTYTGANGKTVTLKDWSTEGKSKRWDKLSENLAAKGVKLELDLIEPDQFDTTIQTMAASGELFNYEMMTRIVKQYAPDLKIEHAVCRGPLDEKVEHWKRVGKLLSISDYVRTYDVVKEFTYSTTIARTWEMFDQDREVQFGCRGIPNIEDAPLLAAGLCCSMGVMRHPCWGGTETDILDFGRKWNEVERALRWQRIAPPFGIWESSAEAFGGLRKDWTEMLSGPEGEGWLKNLIPEGRSISQEAPAILTRNMDCPEIFAREEELPFLACSIHPATGTVSIAFMPRTCGDRKIFTPKADLNVKLGAFVKPIGVFGEFGILTVELGEAVEGRVYLQDLCREEAVEVTDLVAKSRDRIVLDYDALAQNGWLKNDEGDCSAPGFMIWQE